MGAAWRCDRGVYYGDGDQKHVGAGACEGGHADRGFSDPGGLYHRTSGWFGVEHQPFEWRKAGGMALAVIGIVVFKW